jgi:hypothetical protein
MKTIDPSEAAALQNAAAQQRRATDKPAGPDLNAQIIQLVAMFKASDDRGRTLLLKMASIHSTCYPRSK